MTWLIWRQHRNQALAGAGALAVLSALLLVTGVHMATAFRQSPLHACQTAHGECAALASAFSGRFRSLEAVGVLLMVLPLFAGIFWGAPLVARELEHGTHRLAWTQGVTRGRWIVTKVAAVVLAAMLAASALTAVVAWWFGPLARSDIGRMQPVAFDVQGLVPVAYTAFAVALGIAAGAVTRRTPAAMGITLAGFVTARVAVLELARAHFQTPLAANEPVDLHHLGSSGRAGLHDWILGGPHIVDRLGHTVGNLPLLCPARANVPQCVVSHGLRLTETWQPANRFWTFQGIETSIFIALSLGLVALTIWWVRRGIA